MRRTRSAVLYPAENQTAIDPEYFRTPKIQTRNIFEELVKETFRPAHVQIKRSQSTIDYGAIFIPDREPQVFRPSTPFVDPLLVKRADPASLREAFTRFNALYGNRRYYSRFSLGHTGYFDWDLKHAIDSYRGWNLAHRAARHPNMWEYKYVTNLTRTQGFKMASPNLFIRRDQYSNWRDYATSVLAGSLRSDVYWKWRFTNIGAPYYKNRWYLSDSLGLPYSSYYNLY